MSKRKGSCECTRGGENEWRDIFACVVTGPRFPLCASAVGSAAGFFFLRLVNSNATHTHAQTPRGCSREYCTVLLHN